MPTEPLYHQPETSLQTAVGEPMINKLLSAAYSGGTPDALSYTEPTFFDCLQSAGFALSIQGETAGAPAAPGAFSLELHRSLDRGHSWQKFATYTTEQEIYVESPLRSVLWQWRLISFSAVAIRVRART